MKDYNQGKDKKILMGEARWYGPKVASKFLVTSIAIECVFNCRCQWKTSMDFDHETKGGTVGGFWGRVALRVMVGVVGLG